MRVWVWPGNRNDQTLVEQVKADLAGWQLGRAIFVVDSGFSGRDNLRRLRSAGGHYIAGLKLRSGMAETEQALSRQGRYRQVRDNLSRYLRQSKGGRLVLDRAKIAATGSAPTS